MLVAATSALPAERVPKDEAKRLLRDLSNLAANRARSASKARREASARSASGEKAKGVAPVPLDPRLLIEICAELPGCAEGCGPALNTAANVDPAFKASVLERCFPDLKAQDATHPVNADDWFAQRFGRYVVRARGSLPQPDQRRLDATCQALGIKKSH